MAGAAHNGPYLKDDAGAPCSKTHMLQPYSSIAASQPRHVTARGELRNIFRLFSTARVCERVSYDAMCASGTITIPTTHGRIREFGLARFKGKALATCRVWTLRMRREAQDCLGGLKCEMVASRPLAEWVET
jgi:hypothetical protein